MIEAVYEVGELSIGKEERLEYAEGGRSAPASFSCLFLLPAMLTSR